MIQLNRCKTILTFYAHPDDETLAAGATINKLANLGSDVHVAIPATGVHARRNIKDKPERDSDLIELRRNCKEALEILGVPPANISLGNFPDNEVDKHSLLELIQWIEKIINDVKPDLVLTHHRYCTNIDHQYCHEAVVVATRPELNNHLPVVCGEVLGSTGYLRPVQWEPNLYIEVSGSNVESKIKAMEIYKDEARLDPHPRSREALTALAKVRGSEAGFYFAESFMVSKMFA